TGAQAEPVLHRRHPRRPAAEDDRVHEEDADDGDARPAQRRRSLPPHPAMVERAMATRTAKGGVLVLGGGFAGSYVARLLGRGGATIVSPENFMLYTPILPEAASGTLEPRHA